MRRLGPLLAILFAMVLPTAAQAPSPVPALPDAPRLTTYSLSGSTCACSVGFALYGDGTDVDEWIQVYVGGTAYLSTDPVYGWSLSSVTGSLATIPRPITNAVLTFTNAQTATVNIVGARRPRRLTQFSENRGVAARDLNQATTDQIASMREAWDLGKRSIVGQPGEVWAPLPSAATRAGKLLAFDGVTGAPIVTAVPTGAGNVLGPGASVAGNVACWNNTTGSLLKDCAGVLPPSQFGPLPWVQANVYAAGSTGAGGVAVRGSLASPVTDGVASWIVQSVTNFAGTAPALYASTIKTSTSPSAYGIAAWGEAKDPVGGNGSSVSGSRWTGSCVGGTLGNCTGATNLGVASVAYAYVIGAENQAWNSTGTDAPASFVATKFAMPVLGTCAGTNMCDAVFGANPNIVVPNVAVTPSRNGIIFPAGTVDSSGSVLNGSGTVTYGINLLNATCSTACFRSPSYLVDGSGNVTSNSEAPNAYLNPNLLISKTAPTIGSCGGGSPAISANNGTAAFRVTVGSATSTCVINLPTATTGWNCKADDITQTTTTIFITKQMASATNSATLGNFNDVAVAANWGTGDVLAVQCGGV